MIRLITALLLLFASTLILFKAPLHFLWLLAVVITNYLYIFIGLSLLVLITAFCYKKYKRAVLLFSLAGIIIYSLPLVAAYRLNNYLPSQVTNAFHGATHTNGLQQPFSFIKMFSSMGIKDVN